MEKIIEIYTWVITNKLVITQVLTSIIGTASVIVKITPTLKDDNILKGVIKFVGKFIALNR